MNKRKVIIRKYGNRRLYDTAASRYVNLADIARTIREGVEVEVVDARGKDVTRVILTQIIVEESRDRDSGLPLQLLQQLVMASDRATHEFLSRYLRTVLELYQKAQTAIRSSVSDASATVANPLDLVRQVLGVAAWPPPPAAPPPPPRKKKANAPKKAAPGKKAKPRP